MQVNQVQSQLLSLHSAYNSCLKSRTDEWLNMDAAAKQDLFKSGESEFCVAERKQYFSYMEHNVPIEFKAIMRLEQGNYWIKMHQMPNINMVQFFAIDGLFMNEEMQVNLSKGWVNSNDIAEILNFTNTTLWKP